MSLKHVPLPLTPLNPAYNSANVWTRRDGIETCQSEIVFALNSDELLATEMIDGES